MALIGKIRERMGTFLVIAIGFSLVAFLLGDVLTSKTSLFADNKNEIGKIAGESISPQDFEAKFQQNLEFYKINNNSENVDAAAMDNLRDQTWNQIINETIFQNVYQDLGILVTTEELVDMVMGRFVHPKILEVPAFKDSVTGAFRPDAVKRYLSNIASDEKAMGSWMNFETGIKRERVAQKYVNMIKGGLYVTKAEAEQDYMANNRNVRMSFVAMKYTDVADSLVVVNDADLKSYYSKHENDYKQEASRNMEFVTFDLAPSQDDYRVAELSLNELKADFEASTKDSDFVKMNSDNKTIKAEYINPSSIPVLYAGLGAVQVGAVLGPYMDGNEFKLVKIRSIQEMPDSAKARHILIRMADGDTAAAMLRADSLKKAIKSGKITFAEAALKMSEDKGSAEKGGDLGWFKEGAMVPEFNDACFKGKKGEMTVVRTNFGFHIIELQDQSQLSKRIQAFYVTRKVEVSTATDHQVYAKANGFVAKYPTGADFDKGIAAEKLNKRNADNVKENDRTIGGLEQSRELIRWAYKANKDELSKVFQLGDKYIIAHLVAIHEKGIATMDEVKDQVTGNVKKEKKAAQFIEKMQGTADLNALASKVKMIVESADNVNFANTYILNYGSEPAIVGALQSVKKGGVTKPTEGRRAVYVARLDDVTEPAAKTDLKDGKASLEAALKQRVDYQLFGALKDKANVVDNRGRFY